MPIAGLFPLSEPIANLSHTFLATAPQIPLPSVAALSHPADMNLDGIAEPLGRTLTAMPHLSGMPSAFWGNLPHAGSALLADTGNFCDTGTECIADTVTAIATETASAPSFLQSALSYAQNFASGHVPALITTGILGAAVFAGYKILKHYSEKFQNDPTRTANQKNFAQAAFSAGRIFGASTAIAAAGYAWGLESTTIAPFLGTALIGSMLFTGNQALSKYNENLSADKTLSTGKKDLYQSGISIARIMSVGAATLITAKMWGIDLGELGTATGFIGGAFTLAIRDLIANIVGWAALVSNQKFKIGDEIDFDGKKGVVTTIGRFGLSDIQLEGVDDAFDAVTHHIPASKALGQTATHLQRHPELIDLIHEGDLVTVNDESGTVAGITKHVLRLHVYDAGGRLRIKKFLLSDLNVSNFQYFGKTPPALPFGLGVGDEIEVGGVTGIIRSYDLDNVVMEIEIKAEGKTGTKKIPYHLGRTSLTGVKLLNKARQSVQAVTNTTAKPESIDPTVTKGV